MQRQKVLILWNLWRFTHNNTVSVIVIEDLVPQWDKYIMLVERIGVIAMLTMVFVIKMAYTLRHPNDAKSNPRLKCISDIIIIIYFDFWVDKPERVYHNIIFCQLLHTHPGKIWFCFLYCAVYDVCNDWVNYAGRIRWDANHYHHNTELSESTELFRYLSGIFCRLCV